MKPITSLVLVAAFVYAVALSPVSAQTSPTGIVGNWQGTLTIPGSKLAATLKISESASGQIAGSLDLPDAGAANLPLEHLAYADRILSFDVNVGAPSHYEGVVSRDATEIIGSLVQGVNPLPP